MGLVSCSSGRTGAAASSTGESAASGGAMSTSSEGGVVSSSGGASTCRARGTAPYVRPDPSCTPGATDPAVTQANIGSTICRDGWTATVRPPESYTEGLKQQQMAAYGDTGPISSYEEDHLVPLDLGGSPTSPQNLWPQPGASPNPKDAVEAAANQAVCDGHLTLAAARAAMAADWVTLGRQLGAIPAAATTEPSGAAPEATCTVSASYSSQYNDYDVYVRSNQPGQSVTVTSSGGTSASWHTDASGYADVYLHAGVAATGQSVTARVGGASCSTTL